MPDSAISDFPAHATMPQVPSPDTGEGLGCGRSLADPSHCEALLVIVIGARVTVRTRVDQRFDLVSHLEVGSARGNCRRCHRFPDPHVVQVIVKLPSALKTGDVGFSRLGPWFVERRHRSGDPPVAATTQQVQHGVDHVFTLQTEAEGDFLP